jgi:MerR family copper efflux transcriptional regulator
MNIGEAARASGISAKMIRYYESIGLVPAADRRDSGYRDYGEEDVYRLRFVRRARELGFSMHDIGELLALWSDRDRSTEEVRVVTRRHVAELEAQAVKIQEMVGTLRGLVAQCAKGDRPHCPIIVELGGGVETAPATPRAKSGARRSAA